MKLIRDKLGAELPVVFMSTRDDIEARLQAVRAGGLAYFTKPFDVGLLIDQLDTLTSSEPPDHYRVLVVDDEAPMTSFYRAVLEAAGMEVATLNDPMAVMSEMVSFMPEIILMDLYMPGCSGLELAQMIRQQESYVSMPIVYLSAESDRERQLKAMSAGGDDFLTKPIDPAHLVSAVTSRVERWRTLRSFMVRDSLTGLLNHTRTNEELEVEIARARRTQSNLIYAMIDIDFFKNVNDSYGHPTGDRVIKGLARLLQQRLRKVDIVGRVGGEEFAAIMIDTNAENAIRVLDEMRQHFAGVVHFSDTAEFSVTFSCGAADFSEFGDSNSLREAADRALYKAKGEGRNKVVLAEAE